MHKSLTFFFHLSVSELEVLMETFSEDFDNLLNDAFDDKELDFYATKIDSLAAAYVQPISDDLSFEDFTPQPHLVVVQEEFFKKVQSSLCLENLPYLETNPFQVTYLQELLKRFHNVLVDRGGVFELTFKEGLVQELMRYKTIDHLMPLPSPRPSSHITATPVDPIDFLVRDVYAAYERLKENPPLEEELSLKVKQIYLVIKSEKLSSADLYKKTGLNAKDFDDGLERLKFWLRKH